MLQILKFCLLGKIHHLGLSPNITHTYDRMIPHFSLIIKIVLSNSNVIINYKKYIKYIIFLCLSLNGPPGLMFWMSNISGNPCLTRGIKNKGTFSKIMVLVTEFTTLKFDSSPEFNEMSNFEIVFSILWVCFEEFV